MIPLQILVLNGKLINDYYVDKLNNREDIGVFEILFTNDDSVDNTYTKNNYLKYYNYYDNIDNYKVGFYISFEANGEVFEQLILGPESMHLLTPYLYNYLYDDVNQNSSWYSHIEPEDMKDNTVFSSIKLYSAQNGSEITSPITVTVFTYKDMYDFDSNNNYRGNSYHTMIIYH